MRDYNECENIEGLVEMLGLAKAYTTRFRVQRTTEEFPSTKWTGAIDPELHHVYRKCWDTCLASNRPDVIMC